jgi:general secretion pathway protein A
MSDSLLHWNLTRRPFEAAWDARFFYRGAQHLEALDRLMYVVLEGGMNFGLLTGEIGCGKTLVRAVLQHQLAASDFRFVTIENGGFTVEELSLTILSRLAPPGSLLPQGRLAQMDRLQSLLNEHADTGRQVVIVLDEAQDMGPETLNGLRWITNFNGGGRNLVSLLLIGQPNLRSLVESVPALDQRVGLRFHLQPLASASDSAAYLAHRLHVAGHPNGELFDLEASALIHQLSRGVPRLINRLAKLSLEHGWLTESDRLTAEHVHSVYRDLQRHHLATPCQSCS